MIPADQHQIKSCKKKIVEVKKLMLKYLTPVLFDLPSSPGRYKTNKCYLTHVRLCVYSGVFRSTGALTGSCTAVQRSRNTVPLGDLQRVRERRLSLEGLFIKKTFDGVVGQLFHDNKCFIKVQQHGEVVILPVSQDVDALGQ